MTTDLIQSLALSDDERMRLMVVRAAMAWHLLEGPPAVGPGWDTGEAAQASRSSQCEAAAQHLHDCVAALIEATTARLMATTPPPGQHASLRLVPPQVSGPATPSDGQQK